MTQHLEVNALNARPGQRVRERQISVGQRKARCGTIRWAGRAAHVVWDIDRRHRAGVDYDYDDQRFNSTSCVVPFVDLQTHRYPGPMPQSPSEPV